MTSSIDPNRHYGSERLMGSFGEVLITFSCWKKFIVFDILYLQELKMVNRQMLAVFNTVVTVGGAFSFGFFGKDFHGCHFNFL